MRITGPPPLSSKNIAGKRRDGASFAPAEEPATPATPTGGRAVQPATSVDTLVALAAVDEGLERRRKLAAQAEKGLDRLEALDRELRAGEPTSERLEEIAGWARNMTVPDDPKLAALLREIEVRVLVELAKHGR